MPRQPQERYRSKVRPTPAPPDRQASPLPKRKAEPTDTRPIYFQDADWEAKRSGLATDPLASGQIIPKSGPRGDRSELLDAGKDLAANALGVQMGIWAARPRPNMDTPIDILQEQLTLSQLVWKLANLGRKKGKPRWYNEGLTKGLGNTDDAFIARKMMALSEANARLSGLVGALGAAPKAAGKVMDFLNAGRPTQNPDFRPVPTPSPYTATPPIRKARQ